VVRLLVDDRPGVFHAVGPAEPITLGGLIETCARVAASQVEIVPVSPDGVPPLFPLVRTDWPPLRRGFSPQEEEQALLAQQDGHTSDR
ncbi:MAG: NAD-dependent epimerase/dehydratase, partial [Actinoallomurus sp.]|nr:NAD-dependent epimerase/dehydratase [Actinoallomurus sp.]